MEGGLTPLLGNPLILLPTGFTWLELEERGWRKGLEVKFLKGGNWFGKAPPRNLRVLKNQVIGVSGRNSFKGFNWGFGPF